MQPRHFDDIEVNTKRVVVYNTIRPLLVCNDTTWLNSYSVTAKIAVSLFSRNATYGQNATYRPFSLKLTYFGIQFLGAMQN